MTLLRKISIGLAVVSSAAVVIGTVILKPMADVGVGYVAKQVCSCVHVGKRPFEQCRQDYPQERIEVAELTDLDGVQATIFPIAEASAYYYPNAGCTLE